jgi:hypothetical protein
VNLAYWTIRWQLNTPADISRENWSRLHLYEGMTTACGRKLPPVNMAFESDGQIPDRSIWCRVCFKDWPSYHIWKASR